MRLDRNRIPTGFKDFLDLYSVNANSKYESYVRRFIENKIPSHNPDPLKPNYRFLTNRIVFKLIHAGTDRVGWFEDTFNGSILILLRHPIPVSLSRTRFPLLEVFPEANLVEHFSPEQVAFADKVRRSGSHLEKGIVAWCIHNALWLREKRDSWVVASYEEAVTNPEDLINHLGDKLVLPRVDMMLAASRKASTTTYKSSEERRKLLENDSNRAKLISSWRSKISVDDEKHLMQILQRFEIDLYREGEDSISAKYSLLT